MFKTVNMLVAVTPKMAESSKTLATARTTVSSRVGTTPLFWEPSPLSGYPPFSEANFKNYPPPRLPISESHHETLQNEGVTFRTVLS